MQSLRKLFEPEEVRQREAFFAGYIRKNSTAYLVVATVILLLELGMMARALFIFNSTNRRHLLYFLSYVLLAGATLIMVLRNRNGEAKPRAMSLTLHLYCTAIIIWAILVSWLDMLKGNTLIVYLTVIMSVAGLSLVHPLYYAVNLFASCAALVALDRASQLEYFHGGSRGTYLNLVIFGIISVLLAAQQYRISRREYELTEHLETLSFRDQLTGIFNRRMYDEAMERLAAEDGAALVGIFDLDSFKRLNDSYGHDFGDLCLKQAAAQLRAAFGEQIFRIGGDEFAALCGAETAETAAGLVDGINRALEAEFPGRQVSVSAGFCLRARGSGIAPGALAEAADHALYETKHNGKRGSRMAGRET